MSILEECRAEMMAELLERTANLSPEEVQTQLDKLKTGKGGIWMGGPDGKGENDESFAYGLDRTWGVIHGAKDRDLNIPCVLKIMIDPIVHAMVQYGFNLEDIHGDVNEAYKYAITEDGDKTEATDDEDH